MRDNEFKSRNCLLVDMLEATSLAIHVTYTCPLVCDHCCFSSGPDNKDKLDIALIKEAIENLDQRTVKLIAFTGGEPLLLGRDLNAAISYSHERGYLTRIVTSAHFATKPSRASTVVKGLKASGLDEMTISWDDFHEDYVNFERVENAVIACLESQVKCAINVVHVSGAKWNANRVKEALGSDVSAKIEILDTALNKTGRAKETLGDSSWDLDRFLGPCPYVMTGPTVSARGKLLACCGVIEETNQLTLQDNFNPLEINEAIQRGLEDPLMIWLYNRGPYAIMQFISDEFGVDLPPKNELGGNCEACERLFQDPNFSRYVDVAVQKRHDSIVGEQAILNVLGIGTPDKIAMIWGKESHVSSADSPDDNAIGGA